MPAPNTVATKSALEALSAGSTGDSVIVFGRAAAGDGGGGLFYWAAGDHTTEVGTDPNGGVYVPPSSDPTGMSGVWIRVHDGAFYPEWFGTSSDWGDALSCAFSLCSVFGGIVKMRPGGNYTFTTPVVCPSANSNITWDIRSCRLLPKYSGGAAFQFGDSSAQTIGLSIVGAATLIDADSSGDGGVDQPVFEFRRINDVIISGILGVNWYQIAKWGQPGENTCHKLWIDNCNISMRSNASGGHSHGILGDGAAGGLFLKNTFIEADAANLENEVYFLTLTSSQGPERLDYVTVTGGNLKGWDRAFSAVNARLVNVSTDHNARFDETLDAAFYFEANSHPSKGGFEELTICGQLGSGTNNPKTLLRVKADNTAGTIGFGDVKIRAHADKPTGSVVHISTSGIGAVDSVDIELTVADALPADANQDTVILDGNITDAVVSKLKVDHDGNASNSYRYLIYNNTANTKAVRIGQDVVADQVGTAYVYDPNEGKLPTRFCAIHADGRPRAALHVGPYAFANMAASQTNAGIPITGPTGTVSLGATAPSRGRATAMTAQLLGTITAGSIVVGVSANGGVSMDPNLQVTFTSADGANPRKTVSYANGSAVIAQQGNIRFLFTTDPTYAPATIDMSAFVIFQEM